MNKKTVYTKFNSYRKAKFNLITEVGVENQRKYIYKIAQHEKGRDFIQDIYNSYRELTKLTLPFQVNRCEIIDKKTLRFDYVEGKSLLKEFEEVAKTDGLNEFVNKFKEFEKLLNKLPFKKDTLNEDFKKVFGPYEKDREYVLLSPGLLDLNLDNIIGDKKGKFHLIDYEWCFDFGIPKKYVLFRSIFNFFVSTKFTTDETLNFENVVSNFGITEEEKNRYFDWEIKFQRYVFGVKIKKSDLVSNKDNTKQNLLKQDTLLTNKSGFNQLNLEKDKLQNQNEKLTKQNEKLTKQNEKLTKQNEKLTKQNEKLTKQNEELTKQNEKLQNQNEELHNQRENFQDKYNQIVLDTQELTVFKQTKLWKSLTIYRKLKKYSKNFFINIFRDGPILTFKRIYKRIYGKIDKYIKYKKQQRDDRKKRKLEEKQRKKEEEQRKIDENRYKYWLEANKITRLKRIKMWNEIRALKYKPLISVVMPVYNVELRWIKEAVKSIKGQIYTNWELCIADDASSNQELKKYLKKISRNRKIKVVFRKKNGHISEASNSALKLAKGEFVALMDNDDIIQPHALSETIKVLNKKKDTDFIYSDQDKINMQGERVEPFFKPDWSPDLFLSTNYICHLAVIRKSLIDKVGGFRKGYEGSQDYDLFLRITERTNTIEHIPDILYSWRKIPGSTAAVYEDKGYADKASIQSLKDAGERRDLDAIVEKGLFPGAFRVKYKIKGEPLVSILIPTLDKYKYIKRCISSLLKKTTYENFEVIIIDTGSKKKKVLEFYKELKDNPKIRFLHWNKKFNYSAVNNYGVRNSKGEYILFLNNDTEIITPDWIQGMLEHAQRKEIGAVGVKLYYPNDTIQHAGVILGIAGPSKEESIAGHIMRTHPRKNIIGIPYTINLIRNYSAVTAACLMVNKGKFLEVEGLNEKFRIAFNDVDFCLKLMDKGYYNIYTPYVELYHHESVSVGAPETKTRDILELDQEVKLMKEKWYSTIQEDPFYNINLQWENTGSIIKVEG